MNKENYSFPRFKFMWIELSLQRKLFTYMFVSQQQSRLSCNKKLVDKEKLSLQRKSFITTSEFS